MDNGNSDEIHSFEVQKRKIGRVIKIKEQDSSSDVTEETDSSNQSEQTKKEKSSSEGSSTTGIESSETESTSEGVVVKERTAKPAVTKKGKESKVGASKRIANIEAAKRLLEQRRKNGNVPVPVPPQSELAESSKDVARRKKKERESERIPEESTKQKLKEKFNEQGEVDDVVKGKDTQARRAESAIDISSMSKKRSKKGMSAYKKKTSVDTGIQSVGDKDKLLRDEMATEGTSTQQPAKDSSKTRSMPIQSLNIQEDSHKNEEKYGGNESSSSISSGEIEDISNTLKKYKHEKSQMDFEYESSPDPVEKEEKNVNVKEGAVYEPKAEQEENAEQSQTKEMMEQEERSRVTKERLERRERKKVKRKEKIKRKEQEGRNTKDKKEKMLDLFVLSDLNKLVEEEKKRQLEEKEKRLKELNKVKMELKEEILEEPAKKSSPESNGESRQSYIDTHPLVTQSNVRNKREFNVKLYDEYTRADTKDEDAKTKKNEDQKKKLCRAKREYKRTRGFEKQRGSKI
ncbi:hypothetical protein AX774_g5940 [Zancudomyces culisetae]|uniref:Uncharacterized protein n=1 Tax=Zancudomyces culisetae TaxID=1213189 RepID=A0A1R1PI42_ZANCU|nr:hypothetical protein AX774_g5940 [Zancudomyces culisetae]|eukprot:OMH80618.1 hypothetical protein AX774_g5940 [Zancudomyces culisetae]